MVLLLLFTFGCYCVLGLVVMLVCFLVDVFGFFGFRLLGFLRVDLSLAVRGAGSGSVEFVVFRCCVSVYSMVGSVDCGYCGGLVIDGLVVWLRSAFGFVFAYCVLLELWCLGYV